MRKIKAVLFDMDGLMVDSEPLHLLAFNEVFKRYGKHLSEEDNKRFYLGRTDEESVGNMVERFGLPISPNELSLKKFEAYQQIIETHIVPQPGLLKLLDNLHQSGYKIAVVSNSVLESIKKVIEIFKIGSLINIYASGEEVEHGKPAPDVYLLAAKKLMIGPSECLVLEDSPLGVQAGKNAGMKVFAIPSQYTKDEDFSLADQVLNSLDEVFELINP